MFCMLIELDFKSGDVVGKLVFRCWLKKSCVGDFFSMLIVVFWYVSMVLYGFEDLCSSCLIDCMVCLICLLVWGKCGFVVVWIKL